MSKGGYRPVVRLETHLAEVIIEGSIGLESESVAVKNQTFREIVRLARRCVALLDCFAGPGAGPTLAGAGAG